MQRKIIHIDADCFYAAIEMRDDPTLRGIPMAVGAVPNVVVYSRRPTTTRANLGCAQPCLQRMPCACARI